MSRAFPLQILMDQASSRNEATAARLAEAGARLAEAEKQLDQLLGYRTDYQARFRSAVAAGTDSAGWRNFHEFMDRLDAAIAQQREAVTLAASVQEGVRRSSSDLNHILLDPGTIGTSETLISEACIRAMYAWHSIEEVEHKAVCFDVITKVAEACHKKGVIFSCRVSIDGVGNAVGTFLGSEPDLAPVMMGSHIDTVRTGGRFDGNLGVNAGFLVGHSAIRRTVMGDEATQRHASPDELACMADLLRAVLADRFWIVTHPELLEVADVVEPEFESHGRARRIIGEATWLRTHTRSTALVHHGGGTAPVGAHRPYVLTIHDLQFRTYPQYFSRLKRVYLGSVIPTSARRSAVVAVPSEYVRGSVVDAYGVDPERVMVVPHGIEPAVASDIAPADELRARYALGDGPVLVYPAVTHPHKQHRFLIRMMRDHWRDPDLRLVLCGGEGAVEHEVAGCREVHAEDRRGVVEAREGEERLGAVFFRRHRGRADARLREHAA